MQKTKNSYLWIGIGVVFLLYLFVLVLTPPPIDWQLSYSGDDSIPYGCKILVEQLEKVNPEANFYINNKPVYNYSEAIYGTSEFVFINQKFTPDKLDWNSLLERVSEGAYVFIAASELSENVMDSLQFDYDEFVVFDYTLDQLRLNFVNDELKTDSGYVFSKAYQKCYFTDFDTLSTTILGIDEENRVNFIKVDYGEGAFYLNLNPLAFTNFNMLEESNYEYAFKALSYLEGYNIVWDEYYKEKPRPSTSAVRYILSEEGLRFAWYLALSGLLLYIVFGAKRKQRIIPVFEPPTNTTISFINTIGALYFKRKNHRDIAQKKYNYFLEFLRSRYYIDTSVDEKVLIEEISQKLEIPERSLKKLFSQVQRLKMNASYTEEDLEQFTKNIDFIYQRCNK